MEKDSSLEDITVDDVELRVGAGLDSAIEDVL